MSAMSTWLDIPEQRRSEILAQIRGRVAERLPEVDVDQLSDGDVVRLLVSTRRAMRGDS